MQTRICADVGTTTPNVVKRVKIAAIRQRAAGLLANEFGEGPLDIASRTYVPAEPLAELENGVPGEWMSKFTDALAAETSALDVTAASILSGTASTCVSEIEAEAERRRIQPVHANGDAVPTTGLAQYVQSRFNALPDDPDERGRMEFQRNLWRRMRFLMGGSMVPVGQHLGHMYKAMIRHMGLLSSLVSSNQTLLDKSALPAHMERIWATAVSDEMYQVGVRNAAEFPWTARLLRENGEPIGVVTEAAVKTDTPITVTHMNLMLHTVEMNPRWPGCARGTQCIFNVPSGAGSSVEVSYSAPRPQVVGFLTVKEAAGTAPMPAQPRPCIRCILQFMAQAFVETLRMGYLTPAFVTSYCFAKGSGDDDFPPDLFFPETEPNATIRTGMSQIINIDRLAFVSTTTTIMGTTHRHTQVHFGGNFPMARNSETTR